MVEVRIARPRTHDRYFKLVKIAAATRFRGDDSSKVYAASRAFLSSSPASMSA